MKLKSFKIAKLFNSFDHEIELNHETGITIIIGENGIGKTKILEMIEAIFNKKFIFLKNIDFKTISIEFTDGVTWQIVKEKKDNIPIIKLYLINPKTEKSESRKGVILYEADEDDIRIRRNLPPFYRRVSEDQWEDRRTGNLYSKEELLVRYKEDLTPDLFNLQNAIPKWITERLDENKVSLVKTQRLLSIESRMREDRVPINTVYKYSKALSTLIKSELGRYTDLSSELDRTYPNRLIEKINKAEKITADLISSELKNLEEKRALLDKVGLIEIGKESSLIKIKDTKNNNKTLRYVFKLHVEDSFEKLKLFDDLSSKIKLLIDVINKRFKHKKLSIDKGTGFQFKSTIVKNDKGEFIDIPVDKLSSGEQNELVLFYELLFKTENTKLILIDEPEISLHISWQNTFIDDLKEISKLNNLDILIATHSPDIISSNWDLTVKLKGIE